MAGWRKGVTPCGAAFYHAAGVFYHRGAMGQLNIKDEKLIADARALAELLGTSTTDAVRRAVQEKLARESRKKVDVVIDEAVKKGLAEPVKD